MTLNDIKGRLYIFLLIKIKEFIFATAHWLQLWWKAMNFHQQNVLANAFLNARGVIVTVVIDKLDMS